MSCQDSKRARHRQRQARPLVQSAPGPGCCSDEDYLNTMPTPIPAPEIVERAWRDAPPGREAACQNEILRELRRLLQPRVPKDRAPWLIDELVPGRTAMVDEIVVGFEDAI